MKPTLNAAQCFRIVVAMGWADFGMKYRQSILGYFWSFAPIAVQFVVIYYIFRPFMLSEVQHYALYLFLGLILWQFFAETSKGCMTVLFRKSSVLQSINFPQYLLLLAVGYQEFIILCTKLIIFFVMTILIGSGLSWSYLLAPLALLNLALLALTVGLFLSAYCLRYRDILHMWDVILTIVFWLTPIMYAKPRNVPLSTFVAENFSIDGFSSVWSLLDIVIQVQPVSVLIQDSRRVLLFGEWPSFTHFIVLEIILLTLFAAALTTFKRRSPFIIEEL